MPQLLRTLILEDNEKDSQLLLRELRRGGYAPEYTIVDSAETLDAALKDKTWDVILSDYSMQGLDAPAALAILRAHKQDIPFIIVSGTVNEDVAVAAMKAGAQDFFAKDKLSRLVPAIEREVSDAKARHRAREAEAQFYGAFHTSPVGIVITRLADDTIIDVNQRFTEIFDYTRDDIIGRNAEKLELWSNPGQRKKLLDQLRSAGKVQADEIEFQRASGETGFVLLSAAIIEIDREPHVLKMIQDITERKRWENRLAFQAQLLNTIGQAAIATDVTGKINYWNRFAEALYGWRAEDVLGQDIVDVTPSKTSVEVSREIMASLSKGEPWEGEMILQRRDGSTFPASITNAPVHNSSGEFVGIIGVSSDISKRKQDEETLREAERFARSTLDALSAHIAILDENGTIIAVNQSWIDFAQANDASEMDFLKFNYLNVCDQAIGEGSSDAKYVAEGIRQVMAGHEDKFELEYPCHSPHEKRWFTVRVTRFNDTVPTRVVIAHENVTERKLAELSTEQYAKRLELLHEIDQAILASEKPQAIAQTVLERLLSFSPSHSANITVFDLENKSYSILATTASAVPQRTQGTQHPIEDLEVVNQLQQNSMYVVQDLSTLKEPSSLDQALLSADVRSYARIPLLKGNNLLGSINLFSLEPDAFSGRSLDSAKEVASQLAIALEDTRLLQIEQRRTTELTALQQASLQLTGSLELETVLDTVIDYAILLVEAYDAHIFLYEDENLIFGAAQWEGRKQSAPYSEPRPNGLTYTVARSGQPVIISDMQEHPKYKDTIWEGAIIGLPLKVAGDVKGVMSLAFAGRHHFDEHEIQLLKLLADQAAIAIHNAQLYEQIQHHALELEQHVAERTQELQRTKNRLEIILNSSSDSIVLADGDGKIYQTNPDFDSQFGYSPDALLQQPLTVIAAPDHIDPLIEATHEAVESKTSKRIEFLARKQNQSTFPVDALIAAFEVENTTSIVCSLRDMTLQKRAEAELREALEREKELNQLKTNFTSMVSHEFRTPLAVIRSSAELLVRHSDKMSSDQRVEKFRRIIQQVERLTKLMDDVLLLTRADVAGLEFKPKQLDLTELCHEILEEVSVSQENNVTVIPSYDGECSTVTTDPNLIRHILENLVSNAIKYSHLGGDVQVQIQCSAEAITLQVTDQGIGIPEENQNRLFQSFERAKNVGNIKGTGIGLAIVQRAVQAHRGSIEFESVEGTGTTFIVRLPILNT